MAPKFKQWLFQVEDCGARGQDVRHAVILRKLVRCVSGRLAGGVVRPDEQLFQLDVDGATVARTTRKVRTWLPVPRRAHIAGEHLGFIRSWLTCRGLKKFPEAMSKFGRDGEYLQ